MTELALKHGLSLSDLYDGEGLVRLDRAFVAHLAEADVGLHDWLMAARRDPDDPAKMKGVPIPAAVIARFRAAA